MSQSRVCVRREDSVFRVALGCDGGLAVLDYRAPLAAIRQTHVIDDQKEGIAAFREKRTPKFYGR